MRWQGTGQEDHRRPAATGDAGAPRLRLAEICGGVAAWIHGSNLVPPVVSSLALLVRRQAAILTAVATGACSTGAKAPLLLPDRLMMIDALTLGEERRECLARTTKDDLLDGTATREDRFYRRRGTANLTTAHHLHR